MSDTIVLLGDFAFQDTEVPEQIPFGGAQLLVVHPLIGGGRVIDALGDDPLPMTWGGLFRGQDALDRARYLDSLRVAGQPLLLTWSEFIFQVVIREFAADFQRFYQIPYQITVEVLEDLSNQVTANPSLSLDDAINQDMTTANGLGASIGDSGISSGLSSLQTAINAVSSFAKAAKSTINSVLAPLNTVRGQVTTLMASVNNTVASVTTMGGILPNNPVSTNAANLMKQVNSMTQLSNLHALHGVLGRMNANLSMASSGHQTTVAGGNLFNLAQQHYGDASQWSTIAQANNLTDPQISGIQTLSIPNSSNDSGGVLNP